MDHYRIQLLLDIVHKTLNVPGTEKIRAEALRELSEHNEGMHRMPVPTEEHLEEEHDPNPLPNPIPIGGPYEERHPWSIWP